MRQSVLTSELGKSEFICRDIIKHWLTSVVFRSEDIDTVISDAHGQDLELLIDKLSGNIWTHSDKVQNSNIEGIKIINSMFFNPFFNNFENYQGNIEGL